MLVVNGAEGSGRRGNTYYPDDNGEDIGEVAMATSKEMTTILVNLVMTKALCQ